MVTKIKDIHGAEWAIVPVKATPTMALSGRDQYFQEQYSFAPEQDFCVRFYGPYEKMLSAAPPFPGVPKIDELISSFEEQGFTVSDILCELYARGLIITKDESHG